MEEDGMKSIITSETNEQDKARKEVSFGSDRNSI